MTIAQNSDVQKKNCSGNFLVKVLLTGVVLTSPMSASAAISPEKMIDLNLAEMRAALDAGEIKSAGLVGAYLDRIKTLDQHEAGLKSVLVTNEHALSQAKAWDAWHAKQPAGIRNAALGGIPFLAKDNFDVVGLPNTGGSLALASSIPSSNAYVVQRMLDQGAILLGKTNMSELAASYGWYGYSSVGKQTLNPFNPLRTADGSSSGSAAAVAAKLAPIALGTDTTGSIRSPASVTGTVGMRPTMGLLSRSGIIPMSLTADTSGAITRSVADQATVLDVIQAEDPKDAATKNVSRPRLGFAHGLATSSLAGKTIGVVVNFDGANAEVDDVKDRAVKALRSAGARVVDIRLPVVYETLQPAVLGPIGLAEFRPQFESYLATLGPGQPKDLADFISRVEQLTDGGSRTINPGRLKGLIENLQTRSTDSPEYIRLLSTVLPALRQDLMEIMDSGGYDALFYPTIGCTAPVVPGKTDPTFVCKAYAYAAAKISPATGFPEITVNAGKAQGNLPVGMSFLGRAGADADLLKLAAAFERLTE